MVPAVVAGVTTTILPEREWLMFKMTVTPWRDAAPCLGIGTYYLATETEAAPQEGLVNITLESPLILNARQVRMLVQKYGTDSTDEMTALAGAWTLRREVLQMGHDGIIAAGAAPNEGELTLVTLARANDKPRSPSPDGLPKNAGSQVSRLTIAELAALRSSKSMKRTATAASGD
jgi:hypothetical protein